MFTHLSLTYSRSIWSRKKYVFLASCLFAIIVCVINSDHIVGCVAQNFRGLEIFILAVFGGYSGTYTNVCDKTSAAACTSSCSRPLNSSPQHRLLEIISSANLTLTRQESKDVLSVGESIPESDVIIVSASSSNHYDAMQAMFYNLHNVVFPLVHNVTVVLFDIGLSEEQRIQTEKYCKCTVVTFPSEKFHPHVKKNFCYSWKPIIVRATIEKAKKLLIYQDASVRWTKKIVNVMNRASTTGLQLFRYARVARIPVHTLKQTFDYFGEEPCAFDPFPELAAGLGFYRNDIANIRAILEPWAKCALVSECMCPVDPDSVINCKKPVAHHRCHKFDQSALGIITAKLFNTDILRVISPDPSPSALVQYDDCMPNYFDTIVKRL